MNAVADEKSLGAKSTWRVGTHLFHHSGKETGGRWRVTRVEPGEAPAKKPATRKTQPPRSQAAGRRRRSGR
ncbi:MAG: hypothetical protein Q8O67_23130 [Deltaproteobacteria bacterium]|nr:hypothetical protein [Deltaproteobacteria bacterium]